MIFSICFWTEENTEFWSSFFFPVFLLQLPFATYLLEAILEKINEKKRLVEEYFTVMKDTRWYYDWELFFRSENFMWWSENMHCSPGTVSAPAINSQGQYQNKKSLEPINCWTSETN